jgi:hypothetical protein
MSQLPFEKSPPSLNLPTNPIRRSHYRDGDVYTIHDAVLQILPPKENSGFASIAVEECTTGHVF